MKKNLFFKLLLSLSSLSIQADIYFPSQMSNLNLAKAQYVRNKPYIFFDIHDVLVKGKTFSKIKSFFKSKEKKKIIKTGLKSLFKKKKHKEQTTAENFFEEIEQAGIKGKTKKFNALTQLLNNPYKPMPGMEQILNQLQDSQCSLKILSNISPSALTKLSKRTDMQSIFNKFDLKNINDTHTEKHEWIFKPNPKAYTQTLKRFKLEQSNAIIFVDDKIENVKQAVKHGFLGIHFTSVEQLKKDLQKLQLI